MMLTVTGLVCCPIIVYSCNPATSHDHDARGDVERKSDECEVLDYLDGTRD